jgi:hypothetical protein
MGLGRQFQPCDNWARSRVSSLSLLSHTDPPNGSMMVLSE